MNIPKAKGNSIWLMFEKSDELELQLLIDQLSTEFNSLSFKPHLTLFPGIIRNENLLEKFSILLKEATQFELKVKDIKFSEEFYRSVYLEVEKSDRLMKLFLKSIELFDKNSKPSEFDPHISLFYSNIPVEVKKSIAERFEKLKSREITVDKISLISTDGTPSEWKEIITAQLGKITLNEL